MSRYYFDIKNGHRLIDPTGLDCRDDQQAVSSAETIARQIAVDAPPDQPRIISVLNSDRQEVAKVRVHHSEEDYRGSQQADRRQRPQGSGQEALSAQEEKSSQERK
jgi:hypothetical protein